MEQKIEIDLSVNISLIAIQSVATNSVCENRVKTHHAHHAQKWLLTCSLAVVHVLHVLMQCYSSSFMSDMGLTELYSRYDVRAQANCS